MARRDPIEHACGLLDRALEQRAEGRAQLALRSASKAAALFEEHDGRRSADLANALTCVASAAHDAGDYDAALAAAQRAWSILRPLRDDGNVALDRLKVQAIGWLGQVRIARGEWALAGKVHALALPIGKRLGGADLAGVLNNLGIVCKYLERFAEGRRYYVRALALLERAHGKRSIMLCGVLHNLGGLEHARGKFARGVPYARRGLAIRRRAVGLRHPDVAADAAALAALLEGCGECTEARELYREALSSYRRAYGANHFEVGFNLANLAALEHGEGKLARAAALYARGLAVEERTLGKHPYVALTLQNFGALRIEQGRIAEGRRMLERAAAISEATLGPRHPQTRGVRSDLAELARTPKIS